MIKIVVGLGNPGKKYEKNRHNIGYMTLDELGVNFSQNEKFKAELGEIANTESKVLLVKPTTFMNSSGESVLALKNFYKLENSDILIVNDEIDLQFGKIRLSNNSGSAGHRGVDSIIAVLGKDLSRLRVGIDNRNDRKDDPTEEYVMMDFTPDELKKLQEQIIPEALIEIKNWIEKTR